MSILANISGQTKEVKDIFINVSGEKKKCTSAWKKENEQIKKVYKTKRNVWAWIDYHSGSCIAYHFSDKFVYNSQNIIYVFPSGDTTETYDDIRYFHGNFYVLAKSGNVYKSNNLTDWILLETVIKDPKNESIVSSATPRFYRTKSRLFILWKVASVTSTATSVEGQYTRYCLNEDESDFIRFILPGDYLNDDFKSQTVSTAFNTYAVNFFENEDEDTINFFFIGKNMDTKMQTVTAYTIDANLNSDKRIEVNESYASYPVAENNLMGWYDNIEKSTYIYMKTATYRLNLLVFPLGSKDFNKVSITSTPDYNNSSAKVEVAATNNTVLQICKLSSSKEWYKSLNNMRTKILLSNNTGYLGEFLRAIDDYIFLYHGCNYLNWFVISENKNYMSGYGSMGAIDKGIID